MNVIPVELKVDAIADPETTVVEIVGGAVAGGPTLGTVWVEKAIIWPRDLDGDEIHADTGQSFGVALQTSGHKASCEAYWDVALDVYYIVECAVPDAPSAGTWNFSVSLSDTVFFSSDLRAKCPINKFESLAGTCEECLPGASCAEGTSIKTVEIKPNYWRSDPESSHIYACPYEVRGAAVICGPRAPFLDHILEVYLMSDYPAHRTRALGPTSASARAVVAWALSAQCVPPALLISSCRGVRKHARHASREIVTPPVLLSWRSYLHWSQGSLS